MSLFKVRGRHFHDVDGKLHHTGSIIELPDAVGEYFKFDKVVEPEAPAEAPAEGEKPDIHSMTKAELVDYLEGHGVPADSGLLKKELLELAEGL